MPLRCIEQVEFKLVSILGTDPFTLGSQIISQEKGGTVSHLMADGHGSTRLLTGTSGAISDRYSYDAYGVPLEFAPGVLSPPRTKILYTGEQLDVGLGQIYLRARYYNPTVGRFGVRDTVEGNPNDPLTLHKYAYCQNNPVNMRDPSGNFSLGEITIASFIATTIEELPGYAYEKLRDMLQTGAEASAESIGAMEDQEAESDTATIIVHGVEGLSFSGGHKLGWSKDFQDRLTGKENEGANRRISALPLQHDFYEFNWGGFSPDMDGTTVGAGSVSINFVVGFVPVKSVHQMAFVHLHTAQMLVWMKGYSDMNVISHSWGTCLAYDMLNSGGIEMKHWVSMGSPLNHDVTKPVWNQGLWINCFSWNDPVVFLDMYPRGSLDGWLPIYAPRFGSGLIGHPQVSQPAVDTSPGGHSSYWQHDGVIQRLREDLQ